MIKTLIKTVIVIWFSLSLTACYKASMPAKTAGFVGDYSKLKPLQNDVHTLFYLDKKADWKSYHSIIIHPVRIFFFDESKHVDIKRDELVTLTEYYSREMKAAIGERFKIVRRPGPGVLRLRVAITDVKPTDVVANIISKTLIYLPVDMGEAAMEGELRDSASGEMVAAMVDRRIGSVFSSSLGYTKWGHVKDAFEDWAEQLNSVITSQTIED